MENVYTSNSAKTEDLGLDEINDILKEITDNLSKKEGISQHNASNLVSDVFNLGVRYRSIMLYDALDKLEASLKSQK